MELPGPWLVRREQNKKNNCKRKKKKTTDIPWMAQRLVPVSRAEKLSLSEKRVSNTQQQKSATQSLNKVIGGKRGGRGGEGGERKQGPG